MKICKTCGFWSMEKKGFCRHDHLAVGQFWCCEHWQEQASEIHVDRVAAELPCRTCTVRSR